MFSLLRKRDQRTYRVIISDQSLPQMESVLLKNLPFNAQIAIIGHELAHTAEYQTLNSYQLSIYRDTSMYGGPSGPPWRKGLTCGPSNMDLGGNYWNMQSM